MELERLCTTCWKVSHYNRYLICFSPPLLQASYYKFNMQSSPMPSFNILLMLAAAAKSLQSCLTLCHPRDGSPPGSPVSGILQARTLEWVAISFSNAWKWKVKVNSISRVWLLGTPWTAAYQASPSMGFSRQEYSSGVPLPSLCLILELYKEESDSLEGKVSLKAWWI